MRDDQGRTIILASDEPDFDLALRDLESSVTFLFNLSDPDTIEKMMGDAERIIGAALALNLITTRMKNYENLKLIPSLTAAE